MTIVSHDDWGLSEKGKKDAERHRDKIEDTIKKNVKDVISEESIITKKRGKKVRIPVRGLKDYRFIHREGEDGNAGGAGSGDGEEGDVIARRAKRKKGPGKGDKAGNEKGEDYMEAEVDIDYLIKIMFEDLGLPWIEEKTKAHQLVPKGWKFEAISKKGIQPRIHKKRTMMEAIKRMVIFESEIIKETGCSEEEARSAIIQALGDITDAIELVRAGKVKIIEDDSVFIEDDDLRYKQIEHDVEYHSNCVVIAMMDTSGSMTTDKKYMARSMLFWMVEFLKKCYDNVVIKFVQHTTEANVVDEETFFHKGESGGTYCWTAFDKASYLIDTEFPIEEWNVYCMYLSDGDDWDTQKTCQHIDILLKKNINMLGYVEIKPGSPSQSYWIGNSGGTLLKEIKDTWKFVMTASTATTPEMYRSDEHRFLLSVITSKDHIYPALKHMLFEKRKK